jgi:hypothetical protein
MLAHPHTLPTTLVAPPFMETVKHMRLQVSSIAQSTDEEPGCFELNPTCDYGNRQGAQMCTVVLSTGPEKSTSVQLLMGGEAPADAGSLDYTKQDLGSLTIAVYQLDSRIAHAIIPLDQVWEVCSNPSAGCDSDVHSEAVTLMPVRSANMQPVLYAGGGGAE